MFNLEDYIPEDHLLRKVAEVINFDFVYELTKSKYSSTGAPSVDPVVVIKMALLGYFFGIVSERKLAEDCRLNMAYLWFLGYDIDEKPPDHSILSKARVRFGIEIYQEIFNHIVKLCREAGLIEGDKLFVDSTLVKANASMDSVVSKELFQQLKEPEAYLKQIFEENSRAQDEVGIIEQSEPTTRPKKIKLNDRLISRTDPDASLITRKNISGLILTHKVHLGVDSGKNRIITAVSTTPGSVAEADVAPEIVGRHIFNTGIKPIEVVADKAYGIKKVYRFLKALSIKPSIPRRKPRKKLRQHKLKAGYRYDAQQDVFYCPSGKVMHRLKEGSPTSKDTIMYKVNRQACKGCKNRGNICKAKRPTISRNKEQALYDWVESHLLSDAAKKSSSQRKYWVETAVAIIKTPLDSGKANLRGNVKVNMQALLSAAAHNIKQLIRENTRKVDNPAKAQELVMNIEMDNRRVA